MAYEPDDRYETLMEFLTALIEVFPLEAPVRDRIHELFRHDDHAGDIVPLRRTRPRPIAPSLPSEVTSSTGMGPRGTGARATPGRPVPGYSTTSSLKIELEDEATGTYASTSPRSTQGEPRKRPSQDTIQPKTLIWWIILILVGGQLFWWIYAHLNQPMP